MAQGSRIEPSGGVASGAGLAAAGVVVGAYAACMDLAGASFQLTGAQVADAVGSLVRLRDQAERCLVFLLADAIQRGEVDASNNAGARQWLSGLHPHLEPRDATQLVFVADAITLPANAALAAALHDVTVAAAYVTLKQMHEVTAVLPEATHDEALGWYLTVAETGTVKAVRDLSTQVVAKYGENTLSDREIVAQTREDLRWYELPSGFWRMDATMSPAHGAILSEIITSLAGPRPGVDEHGDPVRDARSPGKRRADALMELVTNAKRLGPHTRTTTPSHDTTRASNTSMTGNSAHTGTSRQSVSEPVMHGGPLLSMIVTTDYTDLHTTYQHHQRHQGHQGHQARQSPGCGRTNLGGYLDPVMLRRYACDAQIIPAILGTRSEPLDVGRSQRLFTTTQRHALALRDHGCTFPSCDRPPSWCEAHHLTPWATGGPSNLTNATLLCERHHTIVHTHGHHGRINPNTQHIDWDTTPAQTPTNTHHAS